MSIYLLVFIYLKKKFNSPVVLHIKIILDVRSLDKPVACICCGHHCRSLTNPHEPFILKMRLWHYDVFFFRFHHPCRFKTLFMDKTITSHDFKAPVNKKNSKDAYRHVKKNTQTQETTDRGKFLICRQCLHMITHRSQQIIVDGAHKHTFANPHGIVFEIGCFKSAIGCGYVGQPSGEFSWFSGFMWQVAVCGSCLTHVGWLFTSSSFESFIGLILDRLAESG